jgi:hypothetical protein
VVSDKDSFMRGALVRGRLAASRELTLETAPPCARVSDCPRERDLLTGTISGNALAVMRIASRMEHAAERQHENAAERRIRGGLPATAGRVGHPDAALR